MKIIITTILIVFYFLIFIVLMKLGITMIGGVWLEKDVTFSWPAVLAAFASSITSGFIISFIFSKIKHKISVFKSFLYGLLSLMLFVFLQIIFEGTESTIRGITRYPEYMSTIYLFFVMGFPAGYLVASIANKAFKSLRSDAQKAARRLTGRYTK